MRTEVLDTNPPAGDALDRPRGALVPVSPAPTEVIPASERRTHPVAVYLARLAPGSRRTMHQALDVVAGLLTEGRANALTLPWPQVRYQHTQAARSRLAERYQPATVNKTLAAVRGVLKEAWRLNLMQADDYHRAVDLRGVSAHTLPRGRALSAGEIRALFVACAADRSPAGARDAAMLASSMCRAACSGCKRPRSRSIACWSSPATRAGAGWSRARCGLLRPSDGPGPMCTRAAMQ